jgi:hypothetical protein
MMCVPLNQSLKQNSGTRHEQAPRNDIMKQKVTSKENIHLYKIHSPSHNSISICLCISKVTLSKLQTIFRYPPYLGPLNIYVKKKEKHERTYKTFSF